MRFLVDEVSAHSQRIMRLDKAMAEDRTNGGGGRVVSRSVAARERAAERMHTIKEEHVHSYRSTWRL